MTHRHKMLAGEPYDPLDPELVAARRRARLLTAALNATPNDRPDRRADLLRQLFAADTDVWLEPPFHCDYGTNITLGRKVFLNFNCVVLDCAPVRIGDHTLLGPGVHIYAATHPLDAATRRGGLESAKPVTIGADVWVGGGAILLPGITVGDRAVIGAGSVVTKDVPADAVVAGNPARVLRTLQS
jgi:maltose O-acetyltransferase